MKMTVTNKLVHLFAVVANLVIVVPFSKAESYNLDFEECIPGNPNTSTEGGLYISCSLDCGSKYSRLDVKVYANEDCVSDEQTEFQDSVDPTGEVLHNIHIQSSWPSFTPGIATEDNMNPDAYLSGCIKYDAYLPTVSDEAWISKKVRFHYVVKKQGGIDFNPQTEPLIFAQEDVFEIIAISVERQPTIFLEKPDEDTHYFGETMELTADGDEDYFWEILAIEPIVEDFDGGDYPFTDVVYSGPSENPGDPVTVSFRIPLIYFTLGELAIQATVAWDVNGFDDRRQRFRGLLPDHEGIHLRPEHLLHTQKQIVHLILSPNNPNDSDAISDASDGHIINFVSVSRTLIIAVVTAALALF